MRPSSASHSAKVRFRDLIGCHRRLERRPSSPHTVTICLKRPLARSPAHLILEIASLWPAPNAIWNRWRGSVWLSCSNYRAHVALLCFILHSILFSVRAFIKCAAFPEANFPLARCVDTTLHLSASLSFEQNPRAWVHLLEIPGRVAALRDLSLRCTSFSSRQVSHCAVTCMKSPSRVSRRRVKPGTTALSRRALTWKLF
jgi:hypothetical protein